MHSITNFILFLYLRNCSQNLPINSGHAGWGKGWNGLLSSAFHVDIGALLLSVGGPGQNGIGHLCPSITVVTLDVRRT